MSKIERLASEFFLACATTFVVGVVVFMLFAFVYMCTGCAKPKDGAPGASGPVGSQGPSGPTGAQGLPATAIVPVQFCPGFVQAYPSTFAESGLCIQGVMYGVYSANGGFLALLPPGSYSSNGINSSCSFTLEPNCVVTP